MSAIIDYRGKSPQKTAHGIPLITAKIVKDGRIEAPSEFIAAEDYEEWMRRGIPHEGDVLMTTEAPLGQVAQLDGRKVALAQRLITLRGKPGLLDNTFLKFALKSEFVQNQLKARATGTTVLGIRQSELRKVLLPIPPLHEQQAIGGVLGSIDNKIELNRITNRTLEAIALATFKSWFADFDPIRSKTEDGRPPDVASKIPNAFSQSSRGLIPRGWEIGPITSRARLLSGGTPKTDREDYWNGSVLWCSAKDVS